MESPSKYNLTTYNPFWIPAIFTTSCSSDALSSPAMMRSYFPATTTAAAASGAWCESAPKHTSTVWLINVNRHCMRHSAGTAGGIAAAFKTQAKHRTEDRNHLSHLHSVSITLSRNLETAPLFSSFLCWKAESAHSCSTVFSAGRRTAPLQNDCSQTIYSTIANVNFCRLKL